MKRSIFAVALGALMTCSLAASSFAVTTSAVADTNTRQSASTSNYGTSTYIAIEPGSQLRYGWFKFNTSSIKSSFDAQYGAGKWAITGISFNGYSWEGWNYEIAGTFTYNYNSNDSWTETGINWSNQPSSTTSQTLVSNWNYTAPGSPNPLLQTVSLGTSSTGLVNDILVGDFVTIDVVSNGTGQVAFESKEYNSSYAAYLNVTATSVPEPASLLVFCSGLIGLVGFTTRKRSL